MSLEKSHKETSHKETSHITDVSQNRIPTETSKKAFGIEPVIFLTGKERPDPGSITRLLEYFPVVHIASSGNLPDSFSSSEEKNIVLHRFQNEESIAAVWNAMLHRIEAPWVLFLKNNERIEFEGFPSGRDLDRRLWMPALIRWKKGKHQQECYQIRLVANTGEEPFKGRCLPDCTDYIHSRGIEVSGQPLNIHRNNDPHDDLDPERELEMPNPSPPVYLVMGHRCLKEGKNVHAAGHYRRAMKRPGILSWDRLAALNGLASSMAEQHKWRQSAELALQSIREQPRQRLPYLILFRINELEKKWKEAHDALLGYYRQKDKVTAASFDKMLSKEETLVLLSEMAFRAGLRDESFRYNKELYKKGQGKFKPELLERLLLFSIELSDYENAVKFFNEMFAGHIPHDVSDVEEKIFEYLRLFMEKGWHKFAAERYQQLLEADPDNQVYVRRWLAAISKCDDIDKGQKIVARMRIKKKTG